jgi:hypothetical protein
LAACYAFDTPFALRYLEQDIYNAVKKSPLSNDALTAIWELLPDGHYIIRAAVESLTHHYSVGKIGEEQNKELEAYIYNDKDLAKLFDEEGKKQKKMRKARRDSKEGSVAPSAASESKDGSEPASSRSASAARGTTKKSRQRAKKTRGQAALPAAEGDEEAKDVEANGPKETMNVAAGKGEEQGWVVVQR